MDFEAALVDTAVMPVQSVDDFCVLFQRPKKRMLLILLAAALFAIYWTSNIWLTLIDTFNLYAAGDDIYNFINLEKLQIGGTPVEIPRIIHRMWPNDEFLKQDNLEITSNFNRCIDLYRKRSQSWTTVLWTDHSIREWLQTHYPQFISTFDAYPFQIQRVDAARYFILYHYGGVYMDMDIGCYRTKDIGDLVDYMEASGKLVALPQTDPVGLSNDVMFASKNSAFFREAIDALPTKNRWFGIHYLTVLYSTGSLFLSLLYYNQKPLERRQIAIIPPRLYAESGTRYFRHLPGSTWHGKDQWIVRHWFVLAIILFLIMLLLLWNRRPLRFRRKQSKLK
jgi:inositol phosphorylceramide mannosyltransferase catalytic subunit